MDRRLPTAFIPETGKSRQLRRLNSLGSATSQNGRFSPVPQNSTCTFTELERLCDGLE